VPWLPRPLACAIRWGPCLALGGCPPVPGCCIRSLLICPSFRPPSGVLHPRWTINKARPRSQGSANNSLGLYSPNVAEVEFSEVRSSKRLVSHRQALDNRPCCTPLGSKHPDVVAVVAPTCIKGLRLVTVQLSAKA